MIIHVNAKKYSTAVVGASGYAGAELLRLLLKHSAIELKTLCAHANAGQSVKGFYPHLFIPDSLVFQPTSVEMLAGHEVIFLALPHGQSAQLAKELKAEYPDSILIDLSADFRLQSAADYQQFYGGEHPGTWDYGMPELPSSNFESQRQKLAKSKTIAVPGCNASAVTFAAVPLLELIKEESLNAVLSVGYSGAGRNLKPNLLFSEANATARAYSIGGEHRHIPEIIQNLKLAKENLSALKLSLTTVLVPMSRGILAVVNAAAKPGVDQAVLDNSFKRHYQDEKFIQLVDAYPSTAQVSTTNNVQIKAQFDENSQSITVVCALDNLVKGTAGAAIQSMNLALGIEETTALNLNGFHP